ncbi:MAG: gp436 family protein [Burkholderiaceae bacterium]
MPATPYVTPESLVAEFGERELIELTDRETPRTNAVVEAVAQRACDRAIAEIDGSLRARYPLPLSSVPSRIPFLALDLARFYLYEIEPPAFVQARFDAARKTLRDLQSGAAVLGIDADGADVTNTPTDLAEFSPGDKVFDRSSA